MDGPLEPRTLGAGDRVQFELIAIARVDPVVLADALYTYRYLYLLPVPAKKNYFVSGCCYWLMWFIWASSRSQLLGVNAPGLWSTCTYLFLYLPTTTICWFGFGLACGCAAFIYWPSLHLHDLHFPLFTFDYFHVLFTFDYLRFSTTKWFHFHSTHTIYVNHQLTFLPRYLITNLGQPERQARFVGTLFHFQTGKRHHRRWTFRQLTLLLIFYVTLILMLKMLMLFIFSSAYFSVPVLVLLSCFLLAACGPPSFQLKNNA